MSLVQNIDNQPVTDSYIIAEGTGAQHASVIRLVRDNLTDFEEFGRVGFEIAPFETAGGTQNRTVAILNREHAMLIMTYMRNTTVVRDFKKRLIKAFIALEQQAQQSAPALTEDEIVHQALAITSRKVKELEAKNKELEPKADAYDTFISGDGTYSVGNVAKMLGMSQNKLFDELRNHKILIAKGAMRNTPYQQYMHHFTVKAYDYERSNGERATSYTTRVQPNGINFIARKLGIDFRKVA